MRLRLFALLGSLALLAILGAPTLAMSVREHLPTAPWQGASSSPVGFAGWHPGWMQPVVRDEQGYLAAMLAREQHDVAAARQLARSPRPAMRALAASIVATDSARVAELQRCLREWYPGTAGVSYRPLAPDLSTLSGAALDQAFLREMITEHMGDVMLSQQVLVRDLAVHPQVARLALGIRNGDHAELVRMQRWLYAWYGLPWRQGPVGMGPRMMGR